MRNDRLRATAICVRSLGFDSLRVDIASAADLPGRVGTIRFGPALIDMLGHAGRVLRHAGRRQQWRDECDCEDVFHNHDFFSGVCFARAADTLPFINSEQHAGRLQVAGLS